VTGGTGFLGRHLVRALLDGDDYDTIVLVDRDPERCARPAQDARVRRQHYDGSFASLASIYTTGGRHDTWHLATHFCAGHGPADVDPLIVGNFLLGAQLLEAAASAPAGRFVNCASVWQFTPDGRAPVSLYASLKRAFGAMLDHYSEHRELACIDLVLGDSYGPDDTRGKLLSAILASRDPGSPLLLSPGAQPLRLTHVRDVVSGLLSALIATATGSTVRHTVISPRQHTVRDVVELAQTLSPVHLHVTLGGRPYRPSDVLIWPADLPPALPGWSESTELVEGLRELVPVGVAGS
jgi:CDP-3, 6-dideoxy-D-glycero-L-glycero-4-hexulose-4-reductase